MQALQNTNSFYSFLIYFFTAILLSACGGGGSGGGGGVVGGPAPAPTVSLSSLALTAVESSLKVSETFQVNATGTYSDGSTKNLTTTVIWGSTDLSVASISASGLVVAVSVGMSSITARLDGVSQEVQFTVLTDIDSLSVTEVSSILKVSETFQLNVSGVSADGSTKDVTELMTWSVVNPEVLEVSGSGLITALSAGNTSIIGTYEGLSTQQNISVKSLTELSISPTSLTLATASSTQLSVTGLYSDGSTEDLTSSVVWGSTDLSVASISASGLVVAVSEGMTSITARVNEVSQEAQVTVLTDIDSLSVTEVSSTLKVSQTFQLNVSGIFADGSSGDVTELMTWSVVNPEVLEVSGSGLITALSAGNTLITGTYKGLSTQQNVSVKALTDLDISPTSLTLATASSGQLSVTGIYSDDSNEAVDNLVTWQSSDEDVATISSSGEVLGISTGTVSITANVDGIISSLSVTITPATLQLIVISSPQAQVIIGLTTSFLATGVYSDGTEQNLSDQVAWSVSDPSIASINPETGFLTALQAGTFSVIASKDGQTTSFDTFASQATVIGIAITPAYISLAKGSSQAVSVNANLSDSTNIDVSDQVEWVSSDSQIAIIEAGSSVVQALSEGVITISAQLLEQQAELSINVTNAELASLSLYPVNASIPLGQTQQYYAQGTFTDGTIQDLTSEVTWLSSNEDTALISNTESLSGLVESINLGSSTLTVVLGDIQQDTLLTIGNAALSSLEVQPADQNVASGTDASIKVMGHFTDGSLINLTSKVIWNSSNFGSVNVASANEGSLESLSQGSALISATLDGVSGLGNVNVIDATLQSLSISAMQTSIPRGISQHLIVTGTYSDTSTKDLTQQVNWQSDNILIATVSNNNTASGLLRAVSPGQLSISASLGEVSNQIDIDVTDAVLTSIEINSETSQINVTSSLSIAAMATFSDSSTQDVSSQVNWLSSDINIAWVGNSDFDKGIVRALSTGTVNISASLQGISSSDVALEVTANPNLPKALNVSVQPNIILNDNNDSAQVSLVLVPSADNGVIADGTPITLTITEGATNREINLVTTNGAVSYSLQSDYDGFIAVTATTSDYSVGSGVSSGIDFSNGILRTGKGSVEFEGDSLQAGSVFYLFARNLTNRIFIINQINIGYLDPNNDNAYVNFPESPLTDDSLISDGDLTTGEFNFIGYELDNNVEASIFSISYSFSDTQSNLTFRLGGTFLFAE